MLAHRVLIAVRGGTAPTPDPEPEPVVFDDVTLQAGDWSIAIIPDPQRYAANPAYYATYYAQTQWVADNAEALNIQLVLNVGDVVDEGGVKPGQFVIADTAWDTIDATGIPYLIAVGNHDYDDDCKTLPKSTRATDIFNSYFGPARFTSAGWWDGGFYAGGKAENSYLLVTIGAVDYIILNLEFAPRQAIVDWAGGLLDTYSERAAIILTHGYLSDTGAYWNNAEGYNLPSGDFHEGQALWNELVKLYANVFLIICGHVTGDGNDWRVDDGDEGNTVNQVVTNYQSPIEPNGGNGYLRVAIFRPSENAIYMRTYSPTLEVYKSGSDHKFELSYD